MQRRRVDLRLPDGSTTWAYLSDEERLLPETAQYRDLRPVGLNGDDAALLLARLPLGTPTSMLGTNGPLLASVADPNNAHNEGLGAYASHYLRDSVHAADAARVRFPHLSLRTTEFWLPWLGTKFDADTGEEPWRPPHRVHDPNDPAVPKLPGSDSDLEGPSFASVDAPPLLARALLRHLVQHPELADRVVRNHDGVTTYTWAQAAAGMLALIDRWRSSNPEGLIEAHAVSGTYASFPFWMDSPYAYFHKDGRLASPPASTIELLEYVDEALTLALRLAQLRPDLGWSASSLREQQETLRAGLLAYYWVPDGQHFARGTDREPGTGEVRRLKVRGSNMGRVLGLLDGEHNRDYFEATVQHLFSPEMVGPAGFLTAASDEVLFSPERYHNGPAWPHDTFQVVEKLARRLPALAMAVCDVLVRMSRNYRMEFAPASDRPDPEPGRWNVRIERPNVHGKLIRPTVIKSPETVTAYAEGARIGAVTLRQQLLSTGRHAATNAPDRALEIALLPQARELLALPSGSGRTVLPLSPVPRRPTAVTQDATKGQDQRGQSNGLRQ